MDNITHSLVAVALSRLFFKRRVAFATSAMVVAANLPDLDVLYSWPGIRYIEYHRGILHSLLMLPVWALLVALGLRWAARRWKPKPPPEAELHLARTDTLRVRSGPALGLPGFGMAFFLGLVGVGSHLLLDWTNGYGIRLFAPLSERWFALDWTPVFDPWLWLIFAVFLGFPMMLGLISDEVGVRRHNPHRLSAGLCLLLIAGWLGLRARQHAAALDLLNAPNVAGMYDGQLPYNWAAFPTTGSPFDWQAVVDLPRNILIADVRAPWDAEDFGRVRPVRSYIKPPQETAMVNAEHTPTAEAFLWFARFPFVDVQDEGSDSLVTLTDMRFAQGQVRPQIRALIRLDGSGRIVSQSFAW